MTKIVVLLIAIAIFLPAWSQNADSLQVISPEDSILIQQLIDEEGLYQADTLKIDLVKLRSDVAELIEERTEKKREEWYRWWYLSENRHYTSLKQPVLHIRKEGFTVYPHLVESMHILQGERSFYNIMGKGHHFDLESFDYDLPVTLSSAEAGLGDWEHSHGNLTIEKGDSFISDSLSFAASVAGISGYWFGSDESASNINFNFKYRTKAGNIRYIHTTWGEEFGSALSYINTENAIERKGNEEIIKFEHREFEAGVRLESSKTDNLKRKQQAFLLRREHANDWLQYDLGFEFVRETTADSSWLVLSGKLSNVLGKSDYTLDFGITGKDNYFAEADVFMPFYKRLGISANAYTWKNDSSLINPKTGSFLRSGGGIAWIDSISTIELIAGFQDDDLSEDWYMESYVNSTFTWKSFDLILKNWTLYFINPDLQIQTEVEIRYNLPFGNALRLQYRNRYFSEMLSNDNYFPASVWHDMLLGVKITSRFEIRLEAVNITENYIFMGEQQAGFTFLYNMYWYFVN